MDYSYRVNRKIIFTMVLENGVITYHDLVDTFGHDRTTASHILRKLHKQGWLNRQKAEDSRLYYYTPSSHLIESYEGYMQLPEE